MIKKHAHSTNNNHASTVVNIGSRIWMHVQYLLISLGGVVPMVFLVLILMAGFLLSLLPC